MIVVMLLAGTYLSTFRETISYGQKGDRPAGSFEKVEAYVLDQQGRPHTVRLGQKFDHGSLPATGRPVVFSVSPDVFRGEVQLGADRVLSADEVRQVLGQPAAVRSA